MPSNNPKRRIAECAENENREVEDIARKKREWYPGAIFHIMNRGTNHKKIFSDDSDYQYFLALIKMMQEKYRFTLHAYCFMTNHYHLLLETENEHISKIMKQIDEFYKRYYNVRYGYEERDKV